VTVQADTSSGIASGDRTYSIATVNPGGLTPGRSVQAYSVEIISGLFDSLTAIDPSGQVVMRAAESVTSRDQISWIIKVRPGQFFHNGEAVTAQSFVDAWNAAAYGPNGWPTNAYFRNVAGYAALNPPSGAPTATTLAGLQVSDDYTLQVTLTEPFNQFPQLLSYPGLAPLPEAAFADLEAFDQHPIGNGPFKVKDDTDTEQRAELVRFEEYAGPRPARSEGVTFTYFPTLADAYADARSGSSDIMLHIPPDLAAEARQIFGDRYQETRSAVVEYLGLPLRDERFAQRDVRRAISMAIDRDRITAEVLGGAYDPLRSLFPPGLPGARAGSCEMYCEYNPDLARAMFGQAGGFEGTLTLFYPEGDDSYDRAMHEVAADLQRNLGLEDVQFERAEPADYFTALGTQASPGPFRFNWVMDYPSVENYLAQLARPGNWVGYEAGTAQDYIGKAAEVADPVKGLPYYQLAEAEFLNDMPVVPLWSWRALTCHSARVTDVHTDPFANLRLEEVQVTS
jgi:peptide/nickel transport system substrate-binding protein/oligopeptide transport system substrate-binding protein